MTQFNFVSILVAAVLCASRVSAPGARLAIIDAPPGKASELPSGVPSNRGGHGVPAMVVIDELTAAGFVHVRTI